MEFWRSTGNGGFVQVRLEEAISALGTDSGQIYEQTRNSTLRVKTEGSIKSQGLSAPYAASKNDSAARKSKRGTTFL
jgi:hypothetical protein